jgi:hypothetical protein
MTEGGLLTYRDRLYIPNCDDLKRFIMDELHKRPYTGHPRYQKMITTTRKQFYWPGLKKDTTKYLAQCIECQHVKEEHRHPARLLQPLPIPKWKWETISMDFITRFPTSTKHNDAIMVVVKLLFLSFCGEEFRMCCSDNPQLVSFRRRRFESESGFIIRTNRRVRAS